MDSKKVNLLGITIFEIPNSKEKIKNPANLNYIQNS
jgi:hypothetical protein